jgi:hypothetical protein
MFFYEILCRNLNRIFLPSPKSVQKLFPSDSKGWRKLTGCVRGERGLSRLRKKDEQTEKIVNDIRKNKTKTTSRVGLVVHPPR